MAVPELAEATVPPPRAGLGLPTSVYDPQQNKTDPYILALLWLAQVCS